MALALLLRSLTKCKGSNTQRSWRSLEIKILKLINKPNFFSMLCTPRGEFNALLEIFRRVFYSSPPISICGGLDYTILSKSLEVTLRMEAEVVSRISFTFFIECYHPCITTIVYFILYLILQNCS